MSNIRKIYIRLSNVARIALLAMGGALLILVILAFTSAPYWARYRLSKYEAYVPQNTKTILIMGGGGFPSEALLMRLWYTVNLANEFDKAKVVVTTPGHFSDSTSTIFQMYQYLVNARIDSTRILIENEGLNTRHQALMAYEMFENGLFEEPLLIVSSPEHIYRSVKSFKKVGFKKVSGKPASDVVLETDLRINDKLLGGKQIIPTNGKSIALRYRFWDYLKYEIEVAREYVAIAYYKLQGWI